MKSIPPRCSSVSPASLAAAACALSVHLAGAHLAGAQPALTPAAAGKPAQPAAPAAAPPGARSPALGAGPAAPQAPAAAAPTPNAAPTAAALEGPGARPGAAPDALAEALGPARGGLTPEDAGKAASSSRPSVRSKQLDMTAAAARVDQALISYFPRLSVSASYTRLSPVETSLTTGSGALVFAQNPGFPVTTGPCPGGVAPGETCVLDAKKAPVIASNAAFEFPTIVNSYSIVASLSVPISDLVLRASQGLAAASHAASAKRIEAEAEALQVAADAKVTYFNWVRAKGQVAVSIAAVAQAKAHLGDARRVFEVGLLSKADVLRLEAQVASADQVQAEAEAFAMVAEQQLRQAIGAPPDKPLEIGVDVLHEPASATSEPLPALLQQAMERRLEIRALDETQFAAQKAESVTRAGYFPRVDAFADGTLGNPNQRIFPQQQRWDFTWDAGVRLTWAVNDVFTTSAALTEAKARTAGVLEQKNALRQGLELEVTSAYSDMRKAASSIEAAERGLIAAEESLRVRLELFRSGKASSVDLIDAETEVTRDRLRRLDARVGLLVAKTRLDHATGRDVKEAPKEK